MQNKKGKTSIELQSNKDKVIPDEGKESYRATTWSLTKFFEVVGESMSKGIRQDLETRLKTAAAEIPVEHTRWAGALTDADLIHHAHAVLVEMTNRLAKEDLIYSKFSKDNIKDLSRFAKRLFESKDPAAKFVHDRLSLEGIQLLEAYINGRQNPAALQAKLVEELNKIISGPSFIKNPAFQHVAFFPSTFLLMESELPNRDLTRVHRLMLEYAFQNALNFNRAEFPWDVPSWASALGEMSALSMSSMALMAIDGNLRAADSLYGTLDLYVRCLQKAATESPEYAPRRLNGKPLKGFGS